MIRVLNVFCIALLGVSILGLYQVSERTRVVGVELRTVERRIVEERSMAGNLQAAYEEVARPDRIQQLAETSLGMSDTATVQLASLSMLPRADGTPAQGARLVKVAVQSGM